MKAFVNAGLLVLLFIKVGLYFFSDMIHKGWVTFF
jgi:hypothetical protein